MFSHTKLFKVSIVIFPSMPEEKKTQFQDLLESAVNIPDAVERSRKYKTIIGLISQEAVRSNDRKYIDEALRIAALVTDDPSKAYVEIIRTISRMKQKDEKAIDEALKITERIDNDLDLSVALYEIVFSFGKSAIEKKDEIIYSESLSLAQKIPMNTYRARAYRNLSRVMLEKDAERAMDLLKIAMEIVNDLGDTEARYKINAFCDTGSILTNLNDKQSYEFLKKAKILADEINDDFERSAVLLKILETEIEIGVKFRDQEILVEAGSLSKKITKEYYKTLGGEALKVLESQF